MPIRLSTHTMHVAGFLFALCLVAAAPLRAETPAAVTWEQCVREASEKNPELLSARANLDSFRYKTRAAYSGYLPQLSAGANYSDSSGSAVTTSGASYSASLSVTQNLFAGFQDEAKVAGGIANEEAAEANLAIARARVSNDLKAAFAGLAYAQDNVTLTENIVRRLEENVRLVELRFESGRENKGSYLLTRATLDQARYERLQAVQALVSAQAQLARALGRSQAGELRAVGEIPVSDPESAPDFERLVQQTPDYRQVAARERSAAADVRLARAALLPSLSVTGTAAREDDNWFPDRDRRTVGVSLAIPLYSGGRDYYGVKSAASSLEAAASNKDNTARELGVNLRQAYARFVQSVEKLKVDRSFVQAATLRAEIARSRYNNGLMSFDEWDRIENDLIQRQKNHLQSQRDRLLAEAAWEQAQGRGAIP